MTIAYVYKWTHIPTLRWYVGSRVAKGCHPNDGYICSSNIVFPMIVSKPEEWKREVIETGVPQEMYDLETCILRTLDAKRDTRSFNQHNNDGICVRWGDDHPNKNPINAKKIGDSLRGVPKSEKSVRKMSDSLKALGEKHPSKKDDVRESKRKKMLAKGDDHHQKTDNAKERARQRVSGENNPMSGKDPWNKGLTGVQSGLSGSNNHQSKRVHTPLGVFETLVEAGESHNVSYVTIRNWAKSSKDEHQEYYFITEEIK